MDPELRAWALEVLKLCASMVVPLLALLRTRVDLDRFAAAQRAKETGQPIEKVMRRKWYHRLKGQKSSTRR